MIESQSPEADAPGCHFGDHRGEHYLAVLRRLQTVLRPRTYLEVGTHSGKSLMQVDCSSIAVDPDFGGLLPNVITSKPSCHFMQMTSDRFFARHDPTALLGAPLDFVFLDGMHQSEFLLRDFIHAERHCRPNSVIALHDCVPTNAHIARRHQQDKSRAGASHHAHWWAGDVWKTLFIVKKYRPELTIVSLDASPTGLALISGLSPSDTRLRTQYFHLIREMQSLTFDRDFPRYVASMNIQPTQAVHDASCIAEPFVR